MMLAYSHSLSYDHQGFRPFGPGHREAAGPVGPAVASAQVHCKLQTVASCALATASTAVMEVSNFVKCCYSGTWRWVKPLIWAEGPPIGLYRTAVVQGLSSLLAEFTISPHVLKNGPFYESSLPFGTWVTVYNVFRTRRPATLTTFFRVAPTRGCPPVSHR